MASDKDGPIRFRSANDRIAIHFDSDFEIDANVISVRHQWVVDRGTVVRFGADREVLA